MPPGGGDFAASVMREMYGGSLPRAATQLLKDHAKARSSSAPAARDRAVFSTGLVERGKARQDSVKVPKVGQKNGMASGYARPPQMPSTGKKMLDQILLDNSNYDYQQEKPVAHGRDCSDAQKNRLQDQYAFNFGTALPTTGVPDGYIEPATRRRVSFAAGSGSAPGSRATTPQKSGLSAEQDRMAADIIEGVRRRQTELAAVDQSLAGYVQRSEQPSEGRNLRQGLRKEMVGASKQRLELKNAIARDMQDLDKLFDLAPAESDPA